MYLSAVNVQVTVLIKILNAVCRMLRSPWSAPPVHSTKANVIIMAIS